MDVTLTGDQLLFQETSRRFLASTCPVPTVREWAETEPGGYPRPWWRRAADLGWTSLLVPEDLGGGNLAGQGLLDLALVAEEVGRAVAPGPLLPANVVAAALAGSGSHPDVLQSILTGDTIPAWCPAAPVGGLGRCRALECRPSGHGWVLTGETSPVEAAADGDTVLVAAAAPDGSLVQMLVPAGTPGLSFTPANSLDLTRRFSVVRFASVSVGEADVIWTGADAAASVEVQLQQAVAIQCAEMVGILDRVLELTVEWAFDRFSFGRPLASYQALKHRFADMRLWLEASHATAAAALRAVCSSSPDASELVSVAKSYIGSRGPALVQDCVQLHGGIGVTWDHDIHLYLRRLVQDLSQFGTPVDHRERIASLIGLDDPDPGRPRRSGPRRGGVAA